MDKIPAGYLHTWNQITTLTWIDDTFADFSSWNHQRDYVARISNKSNDQFRIFEEFPLYSSASALIANYITSNTIVAGKLLSISCFIFLVISTHKLARLIENDVSARISILFLLTSSPFIYYGQAVMSDIQMSLFVALGHFYIEKANEKFEKKFLICSAISFMLAGLSKSYGIIFSLLLVAPVISNSHHINRKQILYVASLIVLAISPTLIWHLWTFTQDGQNEIYSHDIRAKASFVLSWPFLGLMVKRFFSYLGYSPLVVLLLSVVLRIKDKDNRVRLIAWNGLNSVQVAVLLTSILYLCFTSDKLTAHDYYFLPVFVLLIPYLAQFLVNNVEANKHATRRQLEILLCIGFTISFLFSAQRFLKASMQNKDVFLCAKVLQENTNLDQILTIWTDVSRYNSMAYISKRRGYAFESPQIGFNEYAKRGSTTLLVNLPLESTSILDAYLNDKKNKLKAIKREIYKDAKSRERICVLAEHKST